MQHSGIDDFDLPSKSLNLGSEQHGMPAAANQCQTLHSSTPMSAASGFIPKCLDLYREPTPAGG